MSELIEIHQFITSWKENLPEALKVVYRDYWINNVEHEFFGFIPPNPIALFLGTFPVPENRTSGFYYHSDVNLFWKILSNITRNDFSVLDTKLSWLSNNRFAISDILLKAQRSIEESRADSDLNAIRYNNIFQLLKLYPTITDIFLTSGGPKTKSLSGKSAGGWLGAQLRDATRRNIKRLATNGATLTIQLVDKKKVNLHYLITPAPQDDQLGKYLRDNPISVHSLKNVKSLFDISDVKEKYKSFQWATYLINLGIIATDLKKDITLQNKKDILCEYLEHNLIPAQ